MTDYQDHIELRRLQRGRIVTGAIAFVTAFAFLWAEPWAMSLALALQVVIWGTWALVIQGDIRLLQRRAEHDTARANRLRHLRNNVIPMRDTRTRD